MKIRHLLSMFIFLILLTSFLFPSKPFATKWVYPFVVWDGYIYVVQDEYVTEIESEIGQVTKYSDMEQLSGNFSNVYKKGTKYYSIKGINTNDSIAVEDEDGKYKKAIREGEYTFESSTIDTHEQEIIDFPGLLVSILVIFLIGVLLIFYFKKKLKK